jgi:hypothetical protein
MMGMNGGDQKIGSYIFSSSDFSYLEDLDIVQKTDNLFL